MYKRQGLNVLEEEFLKWEESGMNPDNPPKSGEEKYDELLCIWDERGMESFRDFLEYYANLDTGPCVEAIGKMMEYYKGMGVDMLKDAISAPGVSRKLLFKSARKSGAHFANFGEKDADLYKKIKDGCVGGPSIIFKRYAEVGKTFVRDDHSIPVGSVLGLDANALYLHCMAQEMPVYFGIRRKSETGFKPECAWKFLDMFKWLNWICLLYTSPSPRD